MSNSGYSRSDIDPSYEPFSFEGMVSLTGHEEDNVPVKMLRDTGSVQSFILSSALPFSEETYCGSDVLVQGIELGHLKVPLHSVYIKSFGFWVFQSGCSSAAAHGRVQPSNWKRFSWRKNSSSS